MMDLIYACSKIVFIHLKVLLMNIINLLIHPFKRIFKNVKL